MKKNILTIACLLVAAMLLVVSCTPETEKTDLVEAKLSTLYRDLTFEGVDTSSFTLKYTMTPNWTDGGTTEGIFGEATDAELVGGSLGYVTPGYWNIEVTAYGADDVAVYSGEIDTYFNSKSNSASIFLKPIASSTNKVSFNFTMQVLSGAAYGTDYKVKYAVTEGNRTPSMTEFAAPSVSGNIWTFTAETASTLETGYYRATVAIYEVKDGVEKLIGGITKGALLANGITATVKGHVEPSDYINASLKTFFLDVETSLELTRSGSTLTATLTDSTDFDKYDSTLTSESFTLARFWTIDGEVFAQTSDTTKTKSNIVPGVKNASCTTIYSKTVDEVDYFFADTASAQLKVTTLD